MNKIIQEKKGFTLIEMSVVLIIIGLVLVGGITLFRSSIGSAKLSTTKTNLENIKNSIINFAIANGRLPCPDTTTAPPNNTGQSNPLSAGACVFGAGCPTPPCYVPFQTLQLQLPGGKDGYGNVIHYDISYETTAGSGLTNTTQDTFCGVLFEYMSHSNDAGAQTIVPCVTNTLDTADNGQIGSVGQGYGVAAVIISETPVENLFNVPATLRGLNDKNIVGSDREYEMANRANSNTYGNLIAELTYGELYNKICTAQKTKIRIQNYTGATKYVQYASTTTCIPVLPTTGYIDVPLGSTITFYDCQGACQGQCTTCSGCTGCTGTACTLCSTCTNNGGCSTFTSCTGCASGNCSSCNSQCGSPITYNMTGSNDAGMTDWSGAAPWGRDGKVRITGACALGDNISATP